MIGASVLFYLPIVREITLWFGALDADKETVEMLLREGVNVELYPGGLDEMIQPGTVSCRLTLVCPDGAIIKKHPTSKTEHSPKP